MKSPLALITLAVAVAAASSSCIIVTDDASLTVHNHSRFVLTEVHLAPVDQRTWGPNLLPDVLYPGEDLVIVDIDCDTYDVLVVDQFSHQCILEDLFLCFHDESWMIDDVTLAECAFNP
jgi:hypothetical protein